MRRASEVRVTDNHAGGGTMSILTPSCTHELRSKDGALLHRRDAWGSGWGSGSGWGWG
jgi:hypothetical protein